VLQQHPSVKVAHVVGIPHPTRGENVAAVVILHQTKPATSHQPPATELTDFCKERLATYKVPRAIAFMTEDELPTLGSGKVDKTALRAIVEKIIPEP
jgi:long-chain acyl-CoA synthetase